MRDERLETIRRWYAVIAIGLLCVAWPAASFFMFPFAVFGLMVGALPPCQIANDDFITDIIGHWNTISGTFTVGGGVMTTTSSGAVRLLASESPTGHGRFRAEVKLSAAGASNTVSIFGAYEDSSNYLELRVNINGASSTTKFISRSGGSNTELRSVTLPLNADQFYTLTLCWNGQYAIATGAGLLWTATYTGEGTLAGVGASPGAATATFDSVDYSRIRTDNSECEACYGFDCGVCETGEAPPAVSVVISGLTDKGACTSCNSYNGTFILQFFGDPCSWRFSHPTDPCLLPPLAVTLSSSGDGTPVSAEVGWGNAFGGAYRVLTDAGWGNDPLECLGLSESIDSGGVGNQCNVPANGTTPWTVQAIS